MGSGPWPGLPPLPPTWPLLSPRVIWLMVRTVRQGGSEPLGTQMGGGKGRGRGSSHVPSARLFPLPLPNKGTGSPDDTGVGGGLVLSKAGRRGAVGMAMGRGWGWGLPAPLCPPPGVKAKVIPQPLGGWAGRGGGSGQTKNRSPGDFRAAEMHLGPRQSWLREGQQAPLRPWPHPPDGPASRMHQSLWIPEPHRTSELGQVRLGVGGKLRLREKRQS